MQDYLQELEFISQRDGGFLSPEAVVEYAQDPATNLHKHFTWDDATAGHQWRLFQARQLIRVVVTVLPGNDKPCKAYVSMKDDRYAGLGYRPTYDVLQNNELRDTLLREAYNDMQIFVNRYNDLQELASVFREIKRTMPRLQRLLSRFVSKPMDRPQELTL